MRAEVEQIVAGMGAEDSEALLAVGELFRAHALGLNGTSVLEPYASLHREKPLTYDEIVYLRSAVMSYLERGAPRNAESAAHSLAELRDPSLIPWLTDRLARTVRDFSRQGELLGQLLIAMGNCGESITQGRAFSWNAFEANASDA